MEQIKEPIEQKPIKKTYLDARTLTGLAMLTAIVVVLQLMGAFIRLGPFSISLVLAPIIVGAAYYGPTAGAYLGFVFGVTVLLSGDAAAFLVASVPGTVLTVLVKGTLCGLAAGWVYRLTERFGGFVAVLLAGITAPVVNTGIFLLGCELFFLDTIASWGIPTDFVGLVVAMVGLNFLVEMAANLLLTPVIVRLLKLLHTRGH